MPQLFNGPGAIGPQNLPSEAPNRPLGVDTFSDFADAILGALGIRDAISDPKASKAVALGNLITAGIPLAGAAVAGARQAVQAPRTLEEMAEAVTALKAYHGSPHDFDKFSMQKIGTGEGAQAYGHGLYFAEAEATAKAYRDTLEDAMSARLNGKPIRDVYSETLQAYQKTDPDSREGQRLHKIASFLEEYHSPTDMSPQANRTWQNAVSNITDPEVRQWAQGLKHEPSGKMYQVNIKAAPDQFLDWDKPLSQQSDHVKRALGLPIGARDRDAMHADFEALRAAAQQAGKSLADEPFRSHAAALEREFYDAVDRTPMRDMTGGQYYRGDDGSMGGAGVLVHRADQPAASEELKRRGIPGIKYLDQGSRAAGEGSRNYVVFDDSIVDILRKYGILAPLAGAGVAAQQNHGNGAAY